MSTPEPLMGAHLKVERAREQLNGLGRIVTNFLKKNPYAAFLEMDEERREIALGVEVREKPDPEWSVTVGEILHNLRSALDHSFWQLVGNDGGKPHRRTAFPIFRNEAGFALERKGNGRRPGMMQGLVDDSFGLIRSLQPFATGEDARSPLWQLAELNNFDKHRYLQLAGAVIQQAKLALPPMKAGQVIPLRVNLRTIEEDTELLRLHVPAWLEDPSKVDVHTPPVFNVAFGNDTPVPGAVLIDCLGRIGKRVYEVIERVDARLRSLP